MPLKLMVDDHELKVKIDGTLTIIDVVRVKEELSKLINSRNISLDLSEINEFDSSGLQLLYTFIRDKRKEGVKVTLSEVSEIVENMLKTYNIAI